MSGAVRVAVFMSNGSARVLSDNGSGVLSVTAGAGLSNRTRAVLWLVLY